MISYKSFSRRVYNFHRKKEQNQKWIYILQNSFSTGISQLIYPNILWQCDFCHTTYFEPFVSLNSKCIKHSFKYYDKIKQQNPYKPIIMNGIKINFKYENRTNIYWMLGTGSLLYRV